MPELNDLLRSAAERHQPDHMPDFATLTARARRRRVSRQVPVAFAAAGLVAVVVFAATGLGRGPAALLPEPAADSPSPSHPDISWTVKLACPDAFSRNAAPPVHLPDDLGAIDAAFVCGESREELPSTASRHYQEVKLIRGGLARLLEEYARPDSSKRPRICPAVAYSPLTVWLHHESQITKVRAPVTSCRAPLYQASAAYNAVSTETVYRRLVATRPPYKHVASGCTTETKDVLAMYASDPPTRKRRSVAPHPLPDPATVCTYRVDKPGPLAHARLIEGHHLDSRELAAINTALGDSRVDETCTLDGHHQFVAVNSDTNDLYGIYVALDGCAVWQDGDSWRASDELRDLLSG